MATEIEVIDAGEPEGTEDELLERESRIERAQRNAYYEIGLDLTAIHDKHLYAIDRSEPVDGRYSFVTWEEYVEKRWDWSRQRAQQLIDAAAVAEKCQQLLTFSPSCESHVRELLKLELDEDRAEVCRRVIEHHSTPKAKDYADEVQRFLAAKEKNWYTIDEWTALDDDERQLAIDTYSGKTFNTQDNERIEWAQWSWNPVTGCKHECPYCYAREIANRFYPQQFDPSIYPERLQMPQRTKVPPKAEQDTAFKNVFTCSMADLFGRWVPDQWIELVLQAVADAPQWNFLFLTKFPQRLAEIGSIPENAWMGTTVDCQDRVANAEKAFGKLSGGVKWLSVEPMLTPLKFKKLDMFDWVVFGGASASPFNGTPAWFPPFDWIVDLHNQARKANCAIYHKENLGMTRDVRLREYPWEERAERGLPDALRYLGMERQE